MVIGRIMFKDWFKRTEVIKIESQILTLKPDDTLVLSYNYNLTDEQFLTLKKQFPEALIDKHKIILVEGGGKRSILREGGWNGIKRHSHGANTEDN